MVPFRVNGPITTSLMVPLSQLYWSRVRRAVQALNPIVSQVSRHLTILLRNPSIQGGASRAGILKRLATPLGGESDQDHRPSNRPLSTPHSTLKKPGVPPRTPQKHLAIGHQILRSPRMKPTPQSRGGRGSIRGSATPQRPYPRGSRYPLTRPSMPST